MGKQQRLAVMTNPPRRSKRTPRRANDKAAPLMSGAGVTTRKVLPGETPAGTAGPGIVTGGDLSSPILVATTTTGETTARTPFRAIALGATGALTTTTSAETVGEETVTLEQAPAIRKEFGAIPGMVEPVTAHGTIHPTVEARETTALAEARTTSCGMAGGTSPMAAGHNLEAMETKVESRRAGHHARLRSYLCRCSTVVTMKTWVPRRARTCAKWKRGGD